MDGFQRFVTGLEGALKNMAQTVAEQSKRMQTCYKRDAQRLGQSFYMLGHAYSGKKQYDIIDNLLIPKYYTNFLFFHKKLIM